MIYGKVNDEPKRGWIDIQETPDHRFELFDWSEHHDSGALIATFDTFQDAATCGRILVDMTHRKQGWSE